MSEWNFNGKPVEQSDVESSVAFVYLITNTLTGRMYVGKKRLTLTRRKKVKGRTKRKVVRTSSGWENYWGSNKPLLLELETQDKNQYTREILRWCKTLSEASYFEAKEHFARDVLLSDLYYNDWVSVRVTKKHMASLQHG